MVRGEVACVLRSVLAAAMLWSAGCADTVSVKVHSGTADAGAPESRVVFPPAKDAVPAADSKESGPEQAVAGDGAAAGDTGMEESGEEAGSDGGAEAKAEVTPVVDVQPEVQKVCAPGQRMCVAAVAQECAADGMSWMTESCGEQPCFNGKCVACQPWDRKCDGETVLECAADGSAFVPGKTCDFANDGTVCSEGQCVSPCGDSEGATSTGPTNVGCEYWGIDMDQSQEFGGMDAQYAIVVSNTNDKLTAKVEVSNADAVVQTVDAPPNTATIILLPPFNIVRVLKAKLAWRIKSNVPIVAYQFNPLENVGVFSNDASLLLPTYALGTEYVVMAWPHRNWDGTPENPLASNFAVVGTAAEGTSVTIRPACATAAGTDVPALSAGQEWTTTLAQFEVLNVESAGPFLDLTGSTVAADRPVAVFGGHVCANSPPSKCLGGKCIFDPDQGGGCGSDGDCPIIAACDHLEEQLQPVPAWGKHYVLGKTWPRGQAPDFVRVLASQDDTHVTVQPGVVTVPVLSAGQVFDFEMTQHLEINSDKPVLVGQYLEGEDAPGHLHEFCEEAFFFTMTCGGELFGQSCDTDQDCSPNDANIGDPAFMVGVPVEQYRKEYVFLVPTKYASNYVTVTAPAGTQVTLDGGPAAVTFEMLPSGAYQVGRTALAAGSHVLAADHPVGIQVYGWDVYVSYGYPGGMNLEALP